MLVKKLRRQSGGRGEDERLEDCRAVIYAVRVVHWRGLARCVRFSNPLSCCLTRTSVCSAGDDNLVSTFRVDNVLSFPSGITVNMVGEDTASNVLPHQVILFLKGWI